MNWPQILVFVWLVLASAFGIHRDARKVGPVTNVLCETVLHGSFAWLLWMGGFWS
jgi:hypothetical protein